jgi:hypothetical protein
MYEYKCLKCGEFVGTGYCLDTDETHNETEAGAECGGDLLLTGQAVPMTETERNKVRALYRQGIITYRELQLEMAVLKADDLEDGNVHPNGYCDECDTPIADGRGERRMCPVDHEHDCYGDNYNNGGDPIR